MKILKEQYNLKGQIKKVSNVMCELIITSDKYFVSIVTYPLLRNLYAGGISTNTIEKNRNSPAAWICYIKYTTSQKCGARFYKKSIYKQ